MTVAQVLADPALAGLLSNEGPISEPALSNQRSAAAPGQDQSTG